MEQNPKVLVVATSHKTRGGITSVISSYVAGELWRKYHCYWVETHRDKNAIVKLCYFIFGLINFIFRLPFYDIVHIHLSEPPSAIRKIPFMWLAKVLRKKTIVHFHSFSIETTIKSRYSWVYNYLFSKADMVITLSNYWKTEVSLIPGISREKVKVVYNPCSQVESEIKNGVKHVSLFPGKHVILYAGSIISRKGYADLIRAFGKIANSYPDWLVAFAGNGEVEKGKKLAEKLGIVSQIRFLGWKYGSEKESLFRNADVFCLPSYAEGFPMAVLDAWAYGLPVVTTPVGGIPDIAKDGENMLLFAPGDTDTLAICLERLIVDEELRKSLANESVNLSMTKFRLETITKQIGCLYEQLFAENR